MAEKVPITVALYGFVKEQEPIMQAAFANADKWPTPWVLTANIEDARVIIVDLASEDDYGDIENLKQRLPKAEIIALSAKKPSRAKWHLVRQPSGAVSIVGFSQLVLKISHSLKRNPAKVSEPQAEAIAPAPVPKEELNNIITGAAPPSMLDEEDFEQETDDMLPFFNTLDSLLDSKPNDNHINSKRSVSALTNLDDSGICFYYCKQPG